VADYNYFIFGKTLLDTIEIMPENERWRFLQYVVNYGIHGIEPELSGLEKIVWFQMKTLIDNLNKKQRGAPRGNRNAAARGNQNVPDGVPDDGGGGVDSPPDVPDDGGGFQLPEAACDGAVSQLPDEIETIQNNSDELKSNQNNSDELKSIQFNSNQIETNKNKKTIENDLSHIYKNKNITYKDITYKDSSENLKQEFKESQGPPVNLNFKREYPGIEPNMILVWRDKFKQMGRAPPDFALAWQQITGSWSDRNVKNPLPPFRRDFFSLKPDEMQAFFEVLINHPVDEIINAIKNYQFVRDNSDQYEMAHNYGSVFTFLKKGVGTFYLDANIDLQFLKKKRKEAVNG
jgi:hypothetical protein